MQLIQYYDLPANDCSDTPFRCDGKSEYWRHVMLSKYAWVVFSVVSRAGHGRAGYDAYTLSWVGDATIG